MLEIAVAELKAAGAAEVYAFGSAIHGTNRTPADLDLAVKGLPSGVFFKTYGKLIFRIPIHVDLIDLDHPSLVSRHLEISGELVRVG